MTGYDRIAYEMSEDDLSEEVRKLAKDLRLFAYHTPDSRRLAPGFPDWVFISPQGVLWRELKTQSGDLSRSQRQVRDMLIASGHNWAIWRPWDLRSGLIRRELEALRGMSLA